MKNLNTLSGALCALLVLITVGFVQSPLAVAQTFIPANKDTEDPSLLSIGPIGVRVKTDHVNPRQPRSESSSATVKYIFENSLADGKLKLDDVITGVNEEPFKENFSAKIAKAIDDAEGGTGELVLNIERDNSKLEIAFQLKTIGSYSATWPRDCKKSSQILQDACDWLVAHQQTNGRLEHSKRGSAFVLSSIGGLAMLGCDPKRYEKPIKAIVDFEVNLLTKRRGPEGHYQNGKLELWSLTYAAIFLSEYYLATNDQTIPPTLDFLNDEIFHRQFHQADAEAIAHVVATRKRRGDRGDPFPKYWFSHGEVTTRSSGYVHLGANVANACLAWSLLKEAGVNVDMKNYNATMDFIEKTSPTGAMRYTARIGQTSVPPDGFGRTGVLGLAMHIDGNRPEYQLKLKDALNKMYPEHVYFSHATCVLGKAWGVLAIARHDPELFRRLMDECQHDFDLLRLSDGSFVSNPVSKNRHGKIDLLNGGSREKHRWMTAFNALIYALAEKRLYITGRDLKPSKQ